MLFNSLGFIFLFLPAALVVFTILGIRGFRAAGVGWLVAASLFFYGWWNPPTSFFCWDRFSSIFPPAVPLPGRGTPGASWGVRASWPWAWRSTWEPSATSSTPVSFPVRLAVHNQSHWHSAA